ncbi:MAG: hypothetical protein ACWGQW_07985, partial [bacterium]
QVLRSIMRADLDVGVDARFYIDGIRMALITENLPPAGTAMRLANGMINTDGAVTQPCGFLFEQAGSIGGGL